MVVDPCELRSLPLPPFPPPFLVSLSSRSIILTSSRALCTTSLLLQVRSETDSPSLLHVFSQAKIVRQESLNIDALYEKKHKQAEIGLKMSVLISHPLTTSYSL